MPIQIQQKTFDTESETSSEPYFVEEATVDEISNDLIEALVKPATMQTLTHGLWLSREEKVRKYEEALRAQIPLLVRLFCNWENSPIRNYMMFHKEKTQ